MLIKCFFNQHMNQFAFAFWSRKCVRVGGGVEHQRERNRKGESKLQEKDLWQSTHAEQKKQFAYKSKFIISVSICLLCIHTHKCIQALSEQDTS